MRRLGHAAILLGAVLGSGPCPGAAQAAGWDWHLPPWVPKPLVPADNPMSAEKVALGRHLFYDRRLSADGSMSCATCHLQARAFTDGQPLSRGVNHALGVRSAMSLTNVAYLPVLTWANPNLRRLETQMLVPLSGEDPVELGMGGREQELFARLRADPVYRRLFAAAYPGSHGAVRLDAITKAIACFERTLLSFDSAYDRYKHGGDEHSLSDSAKRGEELFFGERLECSHCHGGFNFTDNVQHAGLRFPEVAYHNTGLYNLDGKGGYPPDNPGIRAVTDDPDDEGRFRAPTLRNIAVTAPYMHDGSIATLAEVIRDHYAVKGRAGRAGGTPSPLRDQFLEGFDIRDDELADLLAFLDSLTDARFLGDARFSDPWRHAGADHPDRRLP
jgi:cytochrome c peroxidase